MAVRLFVALRPPAPIRAALLDLMEGVPGARWQDDDQLHLTLRFIGEVDEAVGEDVAAALGQVYAPAPVVRLAGTGRFVKGSRSGALWAGVAPADALQALHRKVDHACVRAGLPPEGRAFHPHLTLARLSGTAMRGPAVERWLADTAGLASKSFALGHLTLYQSHLGHAGAAYEPVMRWPLDPVQAE